MCPEPMFEKIWVNLEGKTQGPWQRKKGPPPYGKTILTGDLIRKS